MTCPQCLQELSHLSIEDSSGNPKTIDECLYCGGHFLENYPSNFITPETARNIDSVIPKRKLPPIENPTCHKCGQVMFSIRDDAVPQTVTVFHCPNNHGDFFPKDQLFLFKKAQQAKINYHKIWGIPLKTAFSVLIPLFVVFTAITVLPNVLKEIDRSQENRVKASEILTKPLITPLAENQVLLSFSTYKKISSSIKFTAGRNDIIVVSKDPDLHHFVSLDNLKPSTQYKYVIILDPDGQKITTSEYTFSTP